MLAQVAAIAGAPRTINALTSLRNIVKSKRPDVISAVDSLTAPDGAKAILWAPQGLAGRYTLSEQETLARGQVFFHTVYSSVADRLLKQLQTIHPDFASLVKVEYSRNLSESSVLSDLETELCLVAAIAVMGGETVKQLESHRRGAVNYGATTEQVSAAEAIAALVMASDIVARV
ncbi:hypothetical protein HDU96_006243 [Phlyctochytrium bullatum]|nr:hypothetical protein HDU96_006243 [Phlyctochytrium bullatum]